MKKKFLAMFLSVILAFGLLTACGEKLTLTADATVEVEIGTRYEIKAPKIGGIKDGTEVKWEYKISFDKEADFEPYVDDDNTFLIDRNGTFTIDYTATFNKQTATAKTVITTKDSAKPTFGNNITAFTVYTGKEATLPDMNVRDNGKYVSVVAKVSKPDGTDVTVTNNKFTPDGSVGSYKVLYTAIDDKGNKAEKEIIAGLRKDEKEVESFDYDYSLSGFSSKLVYDNPATYSNENVHTQGGKALKLDSKGCKNDKGEPSTYIHVATTMAGITDFSAVGAVEMWVYSTETLSGNNGFNLGASKQKAGVYEFAKNVEKNVWTKVTFTQPQLKVLFNGDATKGRQPIDNVLEFTFFVDFWECAYTDFVVYVDDIVIIPQNPNWVAEKYETDTMTVYEVNNFDDIDRFFAVDTSMTDGSTSFELVEDPAFTKEVNGKASKGSLKMKITYKSEYYPSFTLDLTKTLALLGKKLSELPDDAIFKFDIFYAEGDDDAIDGYPYEFLNKEGLFLGKEIGTYLWIENNTWGEGGYTIAKIKEAIKLNNIDDLGRLKTFMYCATEYTVGTNATLYIDNFRLEVPKA